MLAGQALPEKLPVAVGGFTCHVLALLYLDASHGYSISLGQLLEE